MKYFSAMHKLHLLLVFEYEFALARILHFVYMYIYIYIDEGCSRNVLIKFSYQFFKLLISIRTNLDLCIIFDLSGMTGPIDLEIIVKRLYIYIYIYIYIQISE